MDRSNTQWIATALAAWSAAVGFAAVIPPAAAQAQTTESRSFAARTDTQGAVSVTVTPRVLSRSAPAWEFDVALNTHSVDLGDDLTRSAYLIDANGQRQAALEWKGSAPGGHHRKGVLRFAPPASQAGEVELRIEGVGSIPTRSFRWQLK